MLHSTATGLPDSMLWTVVARLYRRASGHQAHLGCSLKGGVVALDMVPEALPSQHLKQAGPKAKDIDGWAVLGPQMVLGSISASAPTQYALSAATVQS